jgi:LPS-assembly protein
VIGFALSILLFLGTQQDQVQITATGEQGRETSISYAKENVIVTYRDMRVEADEVTYDDDTKILTADGHIKFTRGDEHLEATHLSLDVETKVGDFANVSGKLGPGFLITAQETHRTEEGQYQLKNATVTTCEGPRPGWTLALARAVVDPNKRVAAKGSIFRLESVPLFYMPYITIPSEDRARATGFLIPSTSTSTTKGRNIRESFYWAINRSADATFTGEYFTKRGPAGAVDFRAVPDGNARIDVVSLFAKDRLGQGGWSARILAFGDLGHDFRGAANMDLVSSFIFRQIYENGFNTITSPLQHSTAFVSRNRPNASINFLYDRNGVFLSDQPTDQPTVVLRKFPTFEASIPERTLGGFPLYFDADTSVSAIARRDPSITTPSFMDRLDLHPSLELPVLRSSAFDWSQRVGLRETFYTHSRMPEFVSGHPLNRLSFDYTSSFVGPQLERDFGSWRHVIEPGFDYHYVNGVDRFQNTIVVDNRDLLANTNDVEYAITNRFFTNREIFSWRLAQKYFFDPTFGGAIIPGRRNVFAPVLDISGFAFADGYRRFSPIVSTMRLSTSPSTSTDLQMDYDTRDRVFRSAGIIGNVNRGQFVGGVSYFFTRHSVIEIPNNQLRGSLVYGNRLKRGLSAAFVFSYDVQHSVFQGSTAELGYNTPCYGLSFEMSQFNIGNRVESRFTFSFSLKNVGSVGTLRPRERLF